MRLGRRGQVGFIGEDMLYLIAAVLAVTTILIVTVKAFIDYDNQMQRIDVFRAALIKADIAASGLSTQTQGKDIRLIDEDRLESTLTGGTCGAICSGCSGLSVTDLKTGKTYLCGKTPEQMAQENPEIAVATVRLPVSIRISGQQKAPDEYNPGILQVTVSS